MAAIITLAIFFTLFLLISTEKLPNAIASCVGAFLLIYFQIMDQQEAFTFVDANTIGLLCGMMISVAVMRKTGIFEYIAIKGIKITGGSPWRILVVLSLIASVMSAFLDNVTTVLIIVPLTFAVADTIKINPVPILISEVMCANIGGAATLIGDPPNILIGGATPLGFMDFINNNLPVVLIILAVTLVLLKCIYYKNLSQLPEGAKDIDAFDEKRAIQDKGFFIKSLVIFTVTIIAFITHNIHHVSLASISLGGGFIMMMVTRQEPDTILKEVEWPTLFFFFGLFIVIGGLEKTGVIAYLAEKLIQSTGGQSHPTAQLVLWMSALSTSFLNSIPYTATMISVINTISPSIVGDSEPLWWALSMGACLGGNGSTFSAAANMIVVGFSSKTKYPIHFKDYVKTGLPLMLVSIVIVSVYLYVRYYLLAV